MKFCTVVVHILIKDISYDIRLNKSKISPFWGKIFKGTLMLSICTTPHLNIPFLSIPFVYDSTF